MLAALNSVMETVDLLIFSDFNYGCLPQALVEQVTAMAKEKGVMLAADSQASSQMGDVSRFRGMNLITPTEHEARLSTRNSEDGLVVLAEQLRRQANAGNVLLKLGEEGLLIHAVADGDENWITDRIAALNSAAKDVAGAGDSMLVASSLCLAAGGSIWEAACLGSLAAAVQVGRVGNTPLQTHELMCELDQ
jgi:bifunctional ADP-heptose synthase (sugar kinase/adenylyltransferase)